MDNGRMEIEDGLGRTDDAVDQIKMRDILLFI